MGEQESGMGIEMNITEAPTIFIEGSALFMQF
jgi:hypothetical protein